MTARPSSCTALVGLGPSSSPVFEVKGQGDSKAYCSSWGIFIDLCLFSYTSQYCPLSTVYCSFVQQSCRLSVMLELTWLCDSGVDVLLSGSHCVCVCVCVCANNTNKLLMTMLKGELNLDKKWQSDDLFYIIMNKIHPRFNQFWVILKIL